MGLTFSLEVLLNSYSRDESSEDTSGISSGDWGFLGTRGVLRDFVAFFVLLGFEGSLGPGFIFVTLLEDFDELATTSTTSKPSPSRVKMGMSEDVRAWRNQAALFHILDLLSGGLGWGSFRHDRV